MVHKFLETNPEFAKPDFTTGRAFIHPLYIVYNSLLRLKDFEEFKGYI
jgi:hypothetical protein